jgi:hypothetical protein
MIEYDRRLILTDEIVKRSRYQANVEYRVDWKRCNNLYLELVRQTEEEVAAE